jgi:hypothetical protein
MALTDTSIRNAKHGPKPIKLADEKGLFLLLQPSGGKLWRLKYRILGKEKKLGLGTYPDVSLKQACRRRDEARANLAEGRRNQSAGLFANTGQPSKLQFQS